MKIPNHNKNMKITSCLITALSALALLTLNAFGQTRTKTETFDSLASSVANGWMEIDSRTNYVDTNSLYTVIDDYGYTNAMDFGTLGGEAGGYFSRGARTEYVDVYGGLLTLDDYISASGLLVIPLVSWQNAVNYGPIIGHSSTTLVGQQGPGPAEGDNMGACIVFGDQIDHELIEPDGTRAGEAQIAPPPMLLTNVYNWSYNYDPTAGINSTGRFTVEAYSAFVTDTNGIVVTNLAWYDLDATDRGSGVQFDSFGLTSRALAPHATGGYAYIKNVTYTAPPLLSIVSTKLTGPNLLLTINTPMPNLTTISSNAVLAASALGAGATWTAVSGVNFTVVSNHQVTAQFPIPAKNQFYRVVETP
jgi:hypothetical protein